MVRFLDKMSSTQIKNGQLNQSFKEWLDLFSVWKYVSHQTRSVLRVINIIILPKPYPRKAHLHFTSDSLRSGISMLLNRDFVIKYQGNKVHRWSQLIQISNTNKEGSQCNRMVLIIQIKDRNPGQRPRLRSITKKIGQIYDRTVG